MTNIKEYIIEAGTHLAEALWNKPEAQAEFLELASKLKMDGRQEMKKELLEKMPPRRESDFERIDIQLEKYISGWNACRHEVINIINRLC